MTRMVDIGLMDAQSQVLWVSLSFFSFFFPPKDMPRPVAEHFFLTRWDFICGGGRSWYESCDIKVLASQWHQVYVHEECFNVFLSSLTQPNHLDDRFLTGSRPIEVDLTIRTRSLFSITQPSPPAVTLNQVRLIMEELGVLNLNVHSKTQRFHQMFFILMVGTWNRLVTFNSHLKVFTNIQLYKPNRDTSSPHLSRVRISLGDNQHRG